MAVQDPSYPVKIGGTSNSKMSVYFHHIPCNIAVIRVIFVKAVSDPNLSIQNVVCINISFFDYFQVHDMFLEISVQMITSPH